MDDRATVSCFVCHTKNDIGLGADFYEVQSWYRCHSCKNTMEVRLTQRRIEVVDASQLQEGLPVKRTE